MPLNPVSPRPYRYALAAALLTAWAGPAAAQAAAQAAAPGLGALVEAAWARQPEARALPARREAAEARRRAAAAWTPEPPALEAAHRSDRFTGNDGGRELEIGVAVPLWLPGERRHAGALAQAEAAALDSGSAAARLRVAGAVREAWWLSHRAAVDAGSAQAQLEATRRLAADVARRTQAGELSRADQHQAEGALAAAEATAAQAEAALTVALQQLQALTGPVGAVAPLEPEPEPELEPLPAPAAPVAAHPALAEWQDRAMRAERAAALAATQSRAHPELALATTRERGATGERYGQTLTLALRLPFGGGPRHDGRVAEARADAAEAQARLALERDRLQAEQAAAQARVAAARTRLAAAERRAALAGETRGFFDKSFRLGETDLPARLRIEADAAEAAREAARARIELAAAVSAWRQALGLLPP
jgi:cobalt-zinc-cadmium efflux system outer membrane protein